MQCANPECEYLAHPDPEISVGFCCEKCEGRFNGEEWANQGKKKHTAYCTSKDGGAAASFAWSQASQCVPVKKKGAASYGGELSGEEPAAEVEKYDEETEAKLDTWVELKKSKEFEAADLIRDELRAAGVDPQKARPKPGAAAAAKLGAMAMAKGAWSKGGGGFGFGGFAARPGSTPCANPECWYMTNSDPSISQFYCCEKCEGVHNGEEWAQNGKKHYKNCEKVEQPAAGGGLGAGYGKAAAAWGGKGAAAAWGGKGAAAAWGGMGMFGFAKGGGCFAKGKGKWGPY